VSLEVHRLKVVLVQLKEGPVLEGRRPNRHLRTGTRGHIRVHVVIQLGERATFLISEDGRLPLVAVLVVGHWLQQETALLVVILLLLDPSPGWRCLYVLWDLVEIPDDSADLSLDEVPLIECRLGGREGDAAPVRAAERLLQGRLHERRQLLLGRGAALACGLAVVAEVADQVRGAPAQGRQRGQRLLQCLHLAPQTRVLLLARGCRS